MPNHIQNIVTIKGNKEEVAKCAETIFKGDKFSFKNIIPRPIDLEIEKSSRIDEGITLINGTEEENDRKYGFTDWYYWNIVNWGTKCDAYEVDYEVNEHSISLNFQTAWNTPYPIFKEMSRMFPNLSIYVDFADENLGANCGEYEFEGGEETKFDEGDLAFACEIWGYDYDEIMREREEYDEEF